MRLQRNIENNKSPKTNKHHSFSSVKLKHSFWFDTRLEPQFLSKSPILESFTHPAPFVALNTCCCCRFSVIQVPEVSRAEETFWMRGETSSRSKEKSSCPM